MPIPFENVQELVKESSKVSLDDFLTLTSHVTELLSNEIRQLGNMAVAGRLIEVPPEGDATIVGDLHGDLESLSRILQTSQFLQKMDHGERSLLIFLGDYGDRGIFSAEVYHVILTLKESFPEHVILMRGNHEGPEELLASPHDLPSHLRNRFGENWSGAYGRLKELFDQLYSTVVIRDRCVLLHGGVPSLAKSLDDLAYAHLRHPSESHLEEILWSDPEEGLTGTCPSPRGAGKLFGRDVTRRFIEMMNVNVVVRGHEPADLGFKINHEGRILTLFSRLGEPYFNTKGAFLEFDRAEKIEDAFQLKRFVKQW